MEHNGKGKERKLPPFPLPIVPRALSFFSSIAECIFIGISIESLCRGESSGRFVPGRLNILKDWAVLFDVLVLALVFDNVCLFAFLVSYIVDNHSILYF